MIPLGALGIPVVSACRKKIRFRGRRSKAPARSRRNSRTVAPERRMREVRARPEPAACQYMAGKVRGRGANGLHAALFSPWDGYDITGWLDG